MDRLTKEQRCKNMRAVKNKGSKIEVKLGKALWAEGVRYRKNNASVYGKPDFTVKKYKIAIFCDSEFWHGKDWETRKHDHKSNVAFWHKKIERNIVRDNEVNNYLLNQQWEVIRFWGKSILTNTKECVDEVLKRINERKQQIR